MYVGPMLIVDVISATNVKLQKSCSSPSQVVYVDKLKVCRGETPKSWLPVDMDENPATASEDEPKDGKSQDDGVVDDLPNELDVALVVSADSSTTCATSSSFG